MPIKNPVAVYNMDNRPYTEQWRDDIITIDPGKHIVMPRSDAIAFLGRNAGVDAQTSAFKVKNLEIKPYNEDTDMSGITEAEERLATTFKCHMCGLICKDAEALDTHLKTHAGNLYTEAGPAPNEIKCPICDKACKGPAGLRSHMSAHIGKS